MRFAGRSDQREWICSVSGRRAVGGSPHLLSLGAHGSRSASTTGLPPPIPCTGSKSEGSVQFLGPPGLFRGSPNRVGRARGTHARYEPSEALTD